MANPEHLKILKQGVEVWNKWREENPDTKVDLREADLSGGHFSGINFFAADLSEAKLIGANLSNAQLSKAHLRGSNLARANLRDAYLCNAKLSKADLNNAKLMNTSFINQWDDEPATLSGANLTSADLRNADLTKANLSGANFTKANLRHAKLSHASCIDPWETKPTDFSGANLSGADLSEMNLRKANLREAELVKANLHEANLEEAVLVEVNLERADLCRANLYRADLSKACAKSANFQGAQLAKTVFTNASLEGCYLYGSSAWELELEGANQTNLIITEKGKPVISVDNLEVAQFIYLLLNNEKIRHVIDTITSKVVLILGRFTKPRKAVLDAIRNELRQHDYVPVLFDFDKPTSRDIHETVGTLARMARFVIADITNPRSIPQELVSIVEQLPSLPVQPLLKHGSKPWGMYDHIKRYPWVLEIHKYRDLKALLGSLRERVIAPAEEKWNELNQKG